jgi:hypothetical protein
MEMPRQASNAATGARAVFSVPVPTRDRDLAEVRAWLEDPQRRGRSVAWYEVVDYLYRYWKETKGDER